MIAFLKSLRPSRITVISGLIILLVFSLAAAVNPALAASGAEKATYQGFWLWSFLGRLHPMVVHFPIGLLYIALLFELLAWRKKTTQYANSIKILILTGSISAVVSVVLGLVLANTETYGSSVLQLHQWLGIATMALACTTFWLYTQNARRAGLAVLTATVLGVTVAGHYGSELTHGEDYLTSVLPSGNIEEADSDDADGNAGFSFASVKGPLTAPQLQELNIQVRTILAHNCYSCHGETKVKGDLRLDGKQYIFKGGKDGKIVEPFHPENSEIIRRIKLQRSDKKAMPSRGNGLTSAEIETLTFWIKQGAPWPDGPERGLFRVAAMAPRLPVLPQATGNLTDPVDLFVNAYFNKHKVKWGAPVDDRVYIRRVYQDVIGLLPPPDSIDAFINDPRPDKRPILVTRLLSRNDDYTQQWITFWNDILRNDYSGTGYITGGRSGITNWLYTSLQTNKPFNDMVKELVSPDKNSEGFIRGIQWRGTINASQRVEMQAAQNISQVFFGVNLKCASCHNSFVSNWKLDDAYAFANIFADSVLEINRCDKPTGKMAVSRVLFTELGNLDPKLGKKERLRQLADTLVQPKNGRLYRTFVNRIWAQLMGRGIVEPVDIMDNRPWSQDLLDWLAYDFANSNGDIKKLIFTILTSQTYQLPSVAVKDQALLFGPHYVFEGIQRRRMTAEAFTDAVSVAMQPVYPDSVVVFNLLPKNIQSAMPFARASLVKNDAFLTALGRPNRETVSTSRNSQANLLQALELTNGTLFNDALKKAAITLKEKYADPAVLVREMYKKSFGRLPSKEEAAVASKALGAKPSVEAVQDFLWAIALQPEFQLIY
jgi:uncharacterized membrane protein